MQEATNKITNKFDNMYSENILTTNREEGI